MAKGFQFPLDTLLRVRRLHEREAQRKLADQQAILARLDAADASNREEIASCHQALTHAQNGTEFDPVSLARGRAWAAHLRRMIVLRQMERDKELAKLSAFQGQLLEARKQTRVLEKLRERRYDDWRQARDRREQAEAEELAQQMHVRQAAGREDAVGRSSSSVEA